MSSSHLPIITTKFQISNPHQRHPPPPEGSSAARGESISPNRCFKSQISNLRFSANCRPHVPSPLRGEKVADRPDEGCPRATHPPRPPRFTAYCLLPTAYCLLPTSYCLLPTAYCLLPTANCQLPTANCQLPTVNCQLSTANCQLPTVNCQLRHYSPSTGLRTDSPGLFSTCV